MRSAVLYLLLICGTELDRSFKSARTLLQCRWKFSGLASNHRDTLVD